MQRMTLTVAIPMQPMSVTRLAGIVVAAAVMAASQAGAQTAAINDLKGKIFDVHMLEKTFANGLRFCRELDGTNFYFAPRDRLLNLEEYHHALENLVKDHLYNAEARRPWDEQAAAKRWGEVQQLALKQKADCELVSSLPQLEKQLEELEKKLGASDKKD